MRRIATAVALVLALGTAPVATGADNQPPIAVDDPAIPGCNSTGGLGGAFLIVEDPTPQVPDIDPGWTGVVGNCSPLANDDDPDGDPLTLELVGQPAHGQAQWLPEGFLLYTPIRTTARSRAISRAVRGSPTWSPIASRMAQRHRTPRATGSGSRRSTIRRVHRCVGCPALHDGIPGRVGNRDGPRSRRRRPGDVWDRSRLDGSARRHRRGNDRDRHPGATREP